MFLQEVSRTKRGNVKETKSQTSGNAVKRVTTFREAKSKTSILSVQPKKVRFSPQPARIECFLPTPQTQTPSHLGKNSFLSVQSILDVLSHMECFFCTDSLTLSGNITFKIQQKCLHFLSKNLSIPCLLISFFHRIKKDRDLQILSSTRNYCTDCPVLFN